jgi:hypothetical protein
MALVNAKRLGRRWPATAFPQDVALQHFLENKSRYDLWKSSGDIIPFHPAGL